MSKGRLTIQGFEEERMAREKELEPRMQAAEDRSMDQWEEAQDKLAEALGRLPRRRIPMPPEIAKAIIGVMGEIGTIEKKGINTHFNYRFAAVGDILAKVTPLMAKHGIDVFPIEVSRNFVTEHKTLEVSYEMLIFHESGVQWEERPKQTAYANAINSKGGFDDKVLNKCHTAARKYFILALFNIPTGDIPDADEDEIHDRDGEPGPERQTRPLPGGANKGDYLREWCDTAKQAIRLMNTESEMVNWERENKHTLDKVYKQSETMFNELMAAMNDRRGEW